jgi:hypothetical protein
MAAFSYHWSALKITRLTFFFSGLARDSDFLALVDLEVLFFDIFPPASLYPCCILAGVPWRSQRGRNEAGKKASSSSHHNHLISKRLRRRSQRCLNHSAVMTQVYGIFLPELAVGRKNAVECVAPFILWVSRGGAESARDQQRRRPEG